MIKLSRFLILLCSLLAGLQTLNAQDTYWQQEVHYDIEVTLDDNNHTLDGTIKIKYHNHSPDELDYIIFHLWPNAYRTDNTAFAKQQLENGITSFYFSDHADRGDMDKLDFRVDGEFTDWFYYEDHIDICKVMLPKPLKPGESTTIETEFTVRIPKNFSRLGHEGQAYQISQWYPKPAVYDKAGWHPMPYLDQGEFYAEFGTFDVRITLPKNYVVAATGKLQNEKERRWLDELARKTEAIDSFDNSTTFPPSSAKTKTLHYKADNVHDFAWFADKRYHVLKGEVNFDQSGRTVDTWVMFTNKEADFWKDAIDYVNRALLFYSDKVGEYPWPHATAVEGALSAGGGMEYPMVTVIGGTSNSSLLERVIVHEVGHNWFYGILGSNERAHPWMDEGINSFYEKWYFDHHYEKTELQEMLDQEEAKTAEDTLTAEPNFLDKSTGGMGIDQNDVAYRFQAYRHKEQPIATHSEDFTWMNYGIMVYMKTPLGLIHLREAMGEARFTRAMRAFYDQWKFRHPQPEDMRTVFEDVTGREVSWFFDHFLKTTWQVDYALQDISDDTVMVGGRAMRELTIKNKGEVKGPYPVTAFKDGEKVRTVWYGGFAGTMPVLFPDGDYDEFRIDAQGVTPEFNRKNNRMRTNGMFRKVEKLRMQPLLSFHNPNRTEVTYMPLIGWNNYDKTMLGVGVHNGLLYPQKFEYVLMPMFGLGSKDITGLGRIGYYWYPESNLFENISFTLGGQVFTEDYYIHTRTDDPEFRETAGSKYYKVAPSVTFHFRPEHPRDRLSRSLRLRSVQVFRDQAPSGEEDMIIGRSVPDKGYFVNELKYKQRHNRTINPFGFEVTAHQNMDFLKVFAEANYKITYNKKKRGLDIRLFGGTFVYDNTEMLDVRFRTGAYDGRNDYMYDEVFLDRGHRDPVFGQQIALRDGAFRTISKIGQTNEWLLALNLTSDLPFTSLVKLFADVGTYHGAGAVFPDSEPIVYNAGVALTPWPDFIEFYIPLLMSSDMAKAVDANTENFFQRITFSMRIHRLDIFNITRFAKFDLF